MDTIIRAVVVYVILLILFRIAGKRSLSHITTFDFVLLLIISEVVQQAMLADDNSMINAFLLVVTLIGMDILISHWTHRSKTASQLVDSAPLILIDNGKMLKDRMDKERVDESEILQQARKLQGLERLDQIKYAVLEPSGGITIIPKENAHKG